MSSLLSTYRPNQGVHGIVSNNYIEPVFLEAREDVRRVLEVLEHVGSAAPEMQKTRTSVLRAAYEAIMW